MALYSQPNSWQCGPFALKHGLLGWGVFAHENDLARIAGSSERDGTDETQLRRAAAAHGCELGLVRCRTARGARRTLERLLAAQVPVLLCIDQWDHWVTAMGADAHRVVLFDSYFDDSVMRLEPWDRLLARLAFRQRRWRGLWRRTLYDLQPLTSTPATSGLRLSLTPDRVEQLSQVPDGFGRVWDDYGRALRPLVATNGRGNRAQPLDAFLARHRQSILHEVVRQRGGESRFPAERALEHLTLAAELFSARLRPVLVNRAVARAAVITARFLPATLPRMEPLPATTAEAVLAVASA
ncbi:MAG: hypothetical protein OER21_06530 [Gemmatimonadota bacterium]|nr:hypothetical protein [Gemmatimonadota bacterium]